MRCLPSCVTIQELVVLCAFPTCQYQNYLYIAILSVNKETSDMQDRDGHGSKYFKVKEEFEGLSP